MSFARCLGESSRRVVGCYAPVHSFVAHPRAFSSSTVALAETTPTPSAPPDLGTIRPQKRPVGGFKGGVFGFLLGFSVASAFASYYLLEEYKLASNTLQASVEELQDTTQKVSAHIRRIEAVEKELKALTESAAGKDDISRVKTEMKKLYDGLHVEFLDLRSHVWGIQQDVHSLSKKESSSVRISSS